MKFYPVFEPEISHEEIEAVTDALRKGEISGTFGEYLPMFEKNFADFIGVDHAVAVCNGTIALHLAAHVAGIGPGDEVLMSASTNIATALAAIHNHAIPIGVDSETETWNLDLDKLESLINEKTKAIIPVHLYGHPVDMDRLMEIANKHKLIVIEDCAESHGATVRGKMTGSFGDMSCFSFYANKIMTTGEGGMVCTNNNELAEKLRLYRNLGFGKPRFVHEVAGFNFRMTGYQAAMGVAQLNKLPDLINKHRQLAIWYNKHLADCDEIITPKEMSWAKHVYWMYAVVHNGNKKTSIVLEKLRELGVDTRTFFFPINEQPCVLELLTNHEKRSPIAHDLWENGFYLPSSTSLLENDVIEICNRLKEAIK